MSLSPNTLRGDTTALGQTPLGVRSSKRPKGFGDTEPMCRAKCHQGAALLHRQLVLKAAVAAEMATTSPRHPLRPVTAAVATDRAATPPARGPRRGTAPVLTCSVPVLLLLLREERKNYLIRWPSHGSHDRGPGGDREGTGRAPAPPRPWQDLQVPLSSAVPAKITS